MDEVFGSENFVQAHITFRKKVSHATSGLKQKDSLTDYDFMTIGLVC